MSDGKKWAAEQEEFEADERARVRRDKVIQGWKKHYGERAVVEQLEIFRERLHKMLSDPRVSLPREYWQMLEEMEKGLKVLVTP